MVAFAPLIFAGRTLQQPPLLVGVPPPRLRTSTHASSHGFAVLAMTTHRDSVQHTLTGRHCPPHDELSLRVDQFARNLYDHDAHIDRLYEHYRDLWDYIEALGATIASPPPMPLKYK